MIFLLDTNVLIRVLKGHQETRLVLAQLSQQNNLLACCAVNVTELYMGMRPGEEQKTERLVRSLRFYPVSWEVAQLAGDLYRRYRKQGKTLEFADMTIAAVAIVHDLVLVTRNHKHFPMPELKLLPLDQTST